MHPCFAHYGCFQPLCQVSKCPWYQINLSIVISFLLLQEAIHTGKKMIWDNISVKTKIKFYFNLFLASLFVVSSSTCILSWFLLVYSNVLLLPDFGPFGWWKTDCNFAFNIYVSLDPDIIFSQWTNDAFFDIIFH